MDRCRRECRQTNGNVFGSLVRSRILNPLAGMTDHGLTSFYLKTLPALCVTTSLPFNTTVYSRNSGVCPGSCQPAGLRMWATLSRSSLVLRRPMYSSISLGRFPAACTRVGAAISLAQISPCQMTSRACAGARFHCFRVFLLRGLQKGTIACFAVPARTAGYRFLET